MTRFLKICSTKKKKKKSASAVRASKEVSVLFSFVFWVFMQLLHFPVEYCFTIYNVLSASPLQLSCFTERALELAIPVKDINLF